MAGEIIVVRYEITPEQIESKRAQYEALTADSPAGYEAVRVAVGDCRATSVAIEKRRVELKADASGRPGGGPGSCHPTCSPVTLSTLRGDSDANAAIAPTAPGRKPAA